MRTFPVRASDEAYEGLVHVRLVHAPGQSIFLTGALLVQLDGDWLWFEPHLFGPPLLSFLDDDAYAQFDIDLESKARLLIGITRDRFVRSFPGGSHLYRCRIAGPKDLGSHAAGLARLREDGGFDLRLFHHTAPATRPLIEASGVLRPSSWNYQGTTRLTNVAYAYLTSLPRIATDLDLQHIAMSSSGTIYMLLDDFVPPAGVVPIKVYRESTPNRSATLAFWVPLEALAPAHVLRHAPNGDAVYYEAAHPAIFRIGLKPGMEIPFADEQLLIEEEMLKRFEYVVIGDATDPMGITAPFDEEQTTSIFKIEMDAADPLTFWHSHANSNQFDNKSPELQTFEKTNGTG